MFFCQVTPDTPDPGKSKLIIYESLLYINEWSLKQNMYSKQLGAFVLY